MAKTYEYDNPANGGKERVIVDGDRFFINSDWGFGFVRKDMQVSRKSLETSLRFTNAPKDIVEAVLAK